MIDGHYCSSCYKSNERIIFWCRKSLKHINFPSKCMELFEILESKEDNYCPRVSLLSGFSSWARNTNGKCVELLIYPNEKVANFNYYDANSVKIEGFEICLFCLMYIKYCKCFVKAQA